MNILVIGTGYVGTTTAIVFAELGWNVTGLDTDPEKIKQLQQGLLYFYEPGLEDMLRKHVQSKKMSFTTDKNKAIGENDVIFICVGTPPGQDGSADLRYVREVAQTIGQTMSKYKLVVTKSTVPVGTQEKVTDWINAAQSSAIPFDVASNPEFLREGKALSDALHPDRVIIGSNSTKATEILRELYGSLTCPFVITTPKTAEFIKYASNAFLATKISYMNELARLCDILGVNVKEVAYAMGLDPRIGRSFLHAGIGYGGSCFPKDVAALILTAKQYNIELNILEKVVEVNETQYLWLLNKARERLKTFNNKKIAVLGLAFKPDTDDIREAAAIRIIDSMLLEKANIYVYDPVASLPTQPKYQSVTVCQGAEEAILDADAIFLCTEWDIFRQIDWKELKSSMKSANLFDGRNVLNASEMRSFGYFYQGIGYE